MSSCTLSTFSCKFCIDLTPFWRAKCGHLSTWVGYDDQLQSGGDPVGDEHTGECLWDGFWQFVQKLKMRCWGLWVRVVTGLGLAEMQLSGQLDVLPNSPKCLWRQLVVEKWTWRNKPFSWKSLILNLGSTMCFVFHVSVCKVRRWTAGPRGQDHLRHLYALKGGTLHTQIVLRVNGLIVR